MATSCEPPPLKDNSPTKEDREAHYKEIDKQVKKIVAEMLEDNY